jgi:hypothetical protein
MQPGLCSLLGEPRGLDQVQKDFFSKMDIGEVGMLLCGRDPQNVSLLGADDMIE